MRMRAVFASLLTEDDADSVPDLARIIWFACAILCVLAVLLFLGIGLAVALTGRAFNFTDFGTGAAALMGGIGVLMFGNGAALAFKTKSGA